MSPTTGEIIRVVIADDQGMIRSGLRALLDTVDDIRVVAEAPDGELAIELVRAHRPDVVLMDVRMPGLDGLAATRHIRAGFSDVAVIVLTTYDLDEYVYEAIRAGAVGFLLKDGDADDLIKAVRVAARGDALIDPIALRRLLGAFAGAYLSPSAPPPGLTGREVDVLTRVAQGMSNAEISTDLFISETTTKTHIGNLLSKLQARNRAELVIAAYESGLIRPGEAAGPARP